MGKRSDLRWLLSTYIKSWVWPHVPVTLALGVRESETGRFWGLGSLAGQ